MRIRRFLSRVRYLLVTAAPVAVGGQAVIEGVLMRSPRAFAVAVRKPNGEMAITAQDWIPLGERFKPFSWPLLRGVALLFETMAEGMKALHYSAQQAGQEEGEEPLSNAALIGTLVFSMAFAFLMFKAGPHVAATYLNPLLGLSGETSSVAFHITDGVVKLLLFVGYVTLISQMKDIRRVFQYHGAEHKSIHVFESGKPLDVENTKPFSRLHPRCGTTFLFFVILISIFVFAAVFPFLPSLSEQPKYLQILGTLGMKIPLLLPIAGISYELIRMTGKLSRNPKYQRFLAPGMAMQYITTREPDDDQLEVALASLRAALDHEGLPYEKGNFPEIAVAPAA